ncbi:hypothetical protein [Carboxylicivirga sp. M1479]|nr:hypothetical protein [Carboxylicivirga sp. M1479]
MPKNSKAREPQFVDNAKERVLQSVVINRFKDIGLFMLVAIVLTWIVLSI